MRFEDLDTRHYRTVPVVDGYTEWAPRYDEAGLELIDVELLARVDSMDWSTVQRAVDLGCGTGRIGRWLVERGVDVIDGVDLTPAMLERARDKGSYAQLVTADVCETGLARSSYDLLISVLAIGHVEQLAAFFDEVTALATPNAQLVLHGYHPHFLLNGIPTHFETDSDGPLAITNHVHLFSDHVREARRTGWRLEELHECVVDESFVQRKPNWQRHVHRPVTFVMSFAR